ncbi:Na_H_Exchanger domain-containing protein [Cephalotus follicularis]|uniref:Na_H_Exchanger domain-containing protein n=1 Tax=Cephalotus follicularis TaxID=3775 RepID=A0A1Q3DBD3_CEPFO|nr:Na_H_Exchanger domain-containing protein [Cephalotus follicularis]
MGVALSINPFPVLARILAELKLLTTHVGETAMATAAFNDVSAWILLALIVALARNGDSDEHKSPLLYLYGCYRSCFCCFHVDCDPTHNEMGRSQVLTRA